MGRNIIAIEKRKLKRTCYFLIMLSAGFIGGGYAFAFFAVQKDVILHLPLDPAAGLLTQSYGLISLVNLFAVIVGACTLFHTEYASEGIKKMAALPVSIMRIYTGKTVIYLFTIFSALIMETAGLILTAQIFLPAETNAVGQIVLFMGSVFLLTVPGSLLMLLISALNSNMWITIGVGVAGLFSALGYGALGGNTAFLINPFSLIIYPAVHMNGYIPGWIIGIAIVESAVIFIISTILLKRKEWV